VTLNVTVTSTGIPQVLQWLGGVQQRIEDREDVVKKITGAIANIWRDNFDSGGRMVGGWADLRERTQEERAQMGLNPSHPILYRYGNLRAVAIEFFQNIASSSGWGWTSAGDVDDGDMQAATYFRQGKDGATLSFSSVKAVHQYGSSKAYIPDRPFWFVDDSIIGASRDVILDWLDKEVIHG